MGGPAQGVDPHGVELGEEVQRTVFVPIAGKVFRRQVRPFVFARLGARRVGEHPLGGDPSISRCSTEEVYEAETTAST